MRSLLKSVALVALLGGPAMADDKLVTVETSKSVPEVMDALQAAVENAGATVFARIDHQAGAEKAGLSMDAAQTLIFGNPKLGTPAMNDDIRAALFLPLKVAAYSPPEGGAYLVYEDPAAMLGEVGISADAPYVKMMQGALGKLTAAAAQ